MKFRYLAVALVLLSAASGAFAQGALYLNPTAVRGSSSTADQSVFAFLGQGKTSETLYGVTFGGYYDLPLPADLRSASTCAIPFCTGITRC